MAINDLLIRRRTRATLFFSTALVEPALALVSLLPFILRKELHASIYWIALFTSLKQGSVVLSYFWNRRLSPEKELIQHNLLLTGLLGYIPFFFFPFCTNAPALIVLSAFYMVFSKALLPGWLEMLKLNLDEGERKRLFSLSSSIGYLIGILVGIFSALWFKSENALWQFPFAIAGALGIVSVVLQFKLPLNVGPRTFSPVGFKETLKGSFSLLRRDRDYALFQLVFMLGGMGLMMMIPSSAVFWADRLHLTYVQICMGKMLVAALGYIAASLIWSRRLSRQSILFSTSVTCLAFALFALAMFGSLAAFPLIYVSFFFYGVGQAGSHVVWHLSGSIFSGEEKDSRPYSNLNAFFLGVRGLVVPFVSAAVTYYWGDTSAMVAGLILSLAAALIPPLALSKNRPKKQVIA
ncbi:MAG: hypothetical protein A3F09_01140 [Chlamydiae bacterium RIFCSPHIGHO2_12_FULL_49_11]|nr:MAG: hypothetical protein A3F09_01140 [Chlamydiae bacterium RIFCSPHIGHO2_12_FULL_49_11]